MIFSHFLRGRLETFCFTLFADVSLLVGSALLSCAEAALPLLRRDKRMPSPPSPSPSFLWAKEIARQRGRWLGGAQGKHFVLDKVFNNILNSSLP